MQSRDWEAKKNMEFKGTLIVVKDCKKALKFYQDMFGFELIRDNDGNMELYGNLYLQEEKYWEQDMRPEKMNGKALVVIVIQNDITKHYRDIIDNINSAIDWAMWQGM